MSKALFFKATEETHWYLIPSKSAFFLLIPDKAENTAQSQISYPIPFSYHCSQEMYSNSKIESVFSATFLHVKTDQSLCTFTARLSGTALTKQTVMLLK